MKLYTTFLLTACAVVGCDKANEPGTTHTTSVITNGPDNTRMNARDNAGATVTPLDQGNDRVDLDITQAIRKAVMADDALSMDAKNVKVVTKDGVTTLRGPVKSDVERAAIEAKAMACAGVNRVDNQIDIESGK